MKRFAVILLVSCAVAHSQDWSSAWLLFDSIDEALISLQNSNADLLNLNDDLKIRVSDMTLSLSNMSLLNNSLTQQNEALKSTVAEQETFSQETLKQLKDSERRSKICALSLKICIPLAFVAGMVTGILIGRRIK